MVQIETTIWCENCGVEITWAPLVVKDYYYCCQDCFQGLACKCGERMEMEEERRESEGASDSLYG